MFCKINIFSALLLAAALGLQAQSQDTLSAEVLFSQLDTSRIPTGILMDKALAAGPSFYRSDGVNPEAPTLSGFATLDNLWLLRQGTVQDTPVPNTLTMVDSTRSYIARKGDYPVVLTDFNYNLIDSLALQDSLLTLQDSVLIDGPDLSSSPYQTHRFLNATVLDSFYVNSASFVFEQDFYFSNTGLPQNIEIDFGDGQGFRSVTFGTPLTPSYGDYTPNYDGKTATMTVRVKKNGQWVSSSFKVQTITCNASASVPTPSPAPWPNGGDFRNGNISTDFDLVSGNAYIHYRSNPASGEENLFKKPVIIIEGFETGSYDPNKAENYRMGDLGWCQLWGEPFGILNESALEKSPQLFNQLHTDGYDIIMLDFKDSRRSLIHNAALVQELIKRVNQYKTPDADPNIVIGASAGGLISRYALAYMEQQGEDHCTNLWISLDAPHKGANISLGAQYLLEFLATNTVRAISEAQIMRQALNSTAAKQLLLYSIFQSNKGYYPTSQKGFPANLVDNVSQNHLNFRNTMDNMGYPQKLHKVAIASGSRTRRDQGFSGVTRLYRLRSNFRGWEKGAFVDGHLFLDYWDSGGIFMDGHIGFTAHPAYFLFIPVKSETDDNTYRNPANLSSLDRVPGGVRELAREIQTTVANTNLSGFNFTIATNTWYHRDQCFVPSISALDLNTTDYFYDIDAAIATETLPTPFDAVHAPPDDNTLHVEITDGTITSRGDNIDYTLKKIDLIEPVSNPVLASNYNYGEENIVSHTQVINNGKLQLYGNYADSKTGQTPNSGNTHVYKLGGCSSTNLSIEQGGELLIGDASAANKAEFLISSGNSLTISNSGKLTIENGSSLVIQDGANFTFEDGAQIELNGPNAELVIEGKLTVGNNATFTYSGSGKLIFDQDIPWVQLDPDDDDSWVLDLGNYMDIGSNAQFNLAGTDANQVQLVVKRPLYLKDGQGGRFTEVQLQNMGVEIKNLLFIFGKAAISGIKVNQNVSYTGGLRIWDHGNSSFISNSHFSHGNPAVLAISFGSNNPLTILNCTFDDNKVALQVDGGAFSVNGSTFKRSEILPIYGEALSGESVLANCTFDNSGAQQQGYIDAVELKGQQGSRLSVYHSTFDNFQRNLLLDGMDLRSECSNYKNSVMGIDIREGAAYLNESAGNDFTALAKAVVLSGSTERCGLFLENGDNNFDHAGSPGSLTRNTYLEVNVCNNWQWLAGPNGDLDASRNSFNTTAKGSGHHFYHLNTSCGGTMVNHNIYTSGSAQSIGCNTIGTTPVHPASLTLASFSGGGGMVGLPGGGSITFQNAALQAVDSISLYESLRNDLWALNRLVYLQNTSVSVADGYTQSIKNVVYRVMHDALAGAYHHDFLQHDEGADSPKPAVFDSVTALIDDRIAPLNPSDSADHNLLFNHHLGKVHAYRAGGYYQDALSLLTLSGNWTYNFTQQQRAAYWQCVCEAEDNYYGGSLPEEEFAYELQQCNLQYTGYNYKTNPMEAAPVEVNQPLTIKAFPQPVTDWLRIELSPWETGTVSWRISDLSGKVVQQGEEQWSGNFQSLDLSHLKPGVYFIRLKNKQFEKQLKILKAAHR